MMVNECKECGAELTNIPGKRVKEFCGNTCRSNFWQKLQRRKNKVDVKYLKPAKIELTTKKTMPIGLSSSEQIQWRIDNL